MLNDFPYHVNLNITLDVNNALVWFAELRKVEIWIENNIGPHRTCWTYIPSTDLIIGFANEEHKTYFLLAYHK
jgi:hypothetical protein